MVLTTIVTGLVIAKLRSSGVLRLGKPVTHALSPEASGEERAVSRYQMGIKRIFPIRRARSG
jgi:hypothetical protein|nr:hypothetical protein [Neorhizobium tomejilense]